MAHHLDPAFSALTDKKAMKEKHKNKDEFKALSTNEKDELLYTLCVERGLWPQEIPYKK